MGLAHTDENCLGRKGYCRLIDKHSCRPIAAFDPSVANHKVFDAQTEATPEALKTPSSRLNGMFVSILMSPYCMSELWLRQHSNVIVHLINYNIIISCEQ